MKNKAMEKVSKKVKSKLVKGKHFLNDFHKRNTEKALKANEYFWTLSLSWKDMNDQAKRVQPNGKHMQREY